MAAATFNHDDRDPRARRGGRRGAGRGRTPRWVGPVVLGAIVLGMIALFLLRGESITTRDRKPSIVNIVLPPPPPPPPPRPEEKPPEPDKPKIVDQPQPTPDTPPPPTPQQPTPGDNALSAREGPAAGNFGLAVGNGSGTRIGGTPGGGDPFAAYANGILSEISRAAQRDKALAASSWTARVAITVSPDGRITQLRLLDTTGNARRDDALQHLVGLQLSHAPPPGLPVIRLQLNARTGA